MKDVISKYFSELAKKTARKMTAKQKKERARKGAKARHAKKHKHDWIEYDREPGNTPIDICRGCPKTKTPKKHGTKTKNKKLVKAI